MCALCKTGEGALSPQVGKRERDLSYTALQLQLVVFGVQPATDPERLGSQDDDQGYDREEDPEDGWRYGVLLNGRSIVAATAQCCQVLFIYWRKARYRLGEKKLSAVQTSSLIRNFVMRDH